MYLYQYMAVNRFNNEVHQSSKNQKVFSNLESLRKSMRSKYADAFVNYYKAIEICFDSEDLTTRAKQVEWEIE